MHKRTEPIKLVNHRYPDNGHMLELQERSSITGKWYVLCLRLTLADVKEYIADHGLPSPTIFENCQH